MMTRHQKLVLSSSRMVLTVALVTGLLFVVTIAPAAVGLNPLAQTLQITNTGQPHSIAGNPLFVTSNGASFSGKGKGTLVKFDISFPMIPIQREIVRGLDRPADAVCGADGQVYFVDWSRGKVYRVDRDGRKVTELATVNRPEGVTFGPDGNLYVSANDGIWRLRGGAGPAEQVASAYSGLEESNPRAGGLVFLTHGPFAGDLLAVDSAGNRVVRFPAPNFDRPVDFITKALDDPIGVAVNSRGEVFVANFNSKKIQHYSTEGAFLETLGARIQLRPYRPIHLEFGPDDTLYVAEWGDYVGEGWIAHISTPAGELTLISTLVDAWGVGLC